MARISRNTRLQPGASVSDRDSVAVVIWGAGRALDCNAMMEPTVRLRFVKRQIHKDVYHILQQQWMDDEPVDEGPIRYEWRDVPTVSPGGPARG